MLSFLLHSAKAGGKHTNTPLYHSGTKASHTNESNAPLSVWWCPHIVNSTKTKHSQGQSSRRILGADGLGLFALQTKRRLHKCCCQLIFEISDYRAKNQGSACLHPTNHEIKTKTPPCFCTPRGTQTPTYNIRSVACYSVTPSGQIILYVFFNTSKMNV